MTELETLRLTAVVQNQNGQPIPDAKVSWTSRNPSVLSVAADGLASALPTLIQIEATVVATYASLSDSLRVTVGPAIGSVEIREGPGPIPIDWPAKSRLTAVVKNKAGVELAQPPVIWTSSDTTRISVAPVQEVIKGGFVIVDPRVATVTVVGLGDATVAATLGGKSAAVLVVGRLSPTAQAIVWPDTSHILVSMTRTLKVQEVAARVVLRGAKWESTQPAVATVDSLGQVTAIGEGQSTITAILPDRRLSGEIIVFRYPSPLRFVAIALGSDHICALTTDGTPYCWGSNAVGQLANDGVMDRCAIFGSTVLRCSEAPLKVNTNLRFASISAGGSVTCGLTAAGAAYCWGENATGRTGTGLADAIVSRPTAVAGGLTFKTLDVGRNLACGITGTGAAYCWGPHRPGNGNHEGSAVPVLVSGGLTWRLIQGGYYTTCGLTTDNTAYCWGLNSAGQAGVPRETVGCPNQTRELLCVPTRVSPDLSLRFLQIESNDDMAQTCGLSIELDTYCWGIVVPPFSALASTSVPALVNGRFVSLHNRSRPCGVTSAGTVQCWGGWPYDPNPAAQSLSFFVRDFVQGGLNTCASDPGGIYYCWTTVGSGIFPWGTSVGSRTPSVVPGQ